MSKLQILVSPDIVGKPSYHSHMIELFIIDETTSLPCSEYTVSGKLVDREEGVPNWINVHIIRISITNLRGKAGKLLSTYQTLLKITFKKLFPNNIEFNSLFINHMYNRGINWRISYWNKKITYSTCLFNYFLVPLTYKTATSSLFYLNIYCLKRWLDKD